MGGIEAGILNFINSLYNAIQWPGVVLLMAIESACIPIPSEIIMPLAGWMLIRADNMSAWLCLLAGLYGALGNTMGSTAAYWVGAKGGRPFLERYGRYILITRHDLERADGWFEKRGSSSVFISRVLPVIRTFISLPAGIARMRFVKFLVYTFSGSFMWSAALAYAGYLLGQHWEDIRAVMRPFDIPFAAIIVGLIAYYIYRHVKHFREYNSPRQE